MTDTEDIDPDSPGSDGDHVDVDAVIDHLEDLEATVDDPHERREVRRTIGLVDRLPKPSVRNRIKKYTKRDVAEAFVGSVLISLPMLVEDGINTIAEHFLAVPIFFVLNLVFVTAMTAGLIYYADFRHVTVSRPILGIVPRRLTGVLVVSFLATAFAMTIWGRLDGWADPAVAVARISVVWTAAAFGAAIGDILPGESRGEDINDRLDQFGERIGIGDDEGFF